MPKRLCGGGRANDLQRYVAHNHTGAVASRTWVGNCFGSIHSSCATTFALGFRNDARVTRSWRRTRGGQTVPPDMRPRETRRLWRARTARVLHRFASSGRWIAASAAAHSTNADATANWGGIDESIRSTSLVAQRTRASPHLSVRQPRRDFRAPEGECAPEAPAS